jgi:oligosaccharide repeat unit polymerase
MVEKVEKIKFMFANNGKISLYYLLSFIILFIYLIESFNPVNATYYAPEYFFIIISLIFVSFFYYRTVIYTPFNIFHPIHIYMFFYICIFFITPVFLINEGRTRCDGVNVMGGCIPATTIVLLSLCTYFIGYSQPAILYNTHKVRNPDFNIKQKILNLSYIIFICLYIICIGIAISSGKNIIYIFSLGNNTPYIVQKAVYSDMLFLINICYSLLVPWLFICAYSKSKTVKIGISYLLFALFFSYGWRFIVYIMAIAYSIVYFRVNNKKPTFKFIFILFIILLIFSVILGAVRNDIRTGERANYDGFDKNNVAYTLESNFNIYQPFYAIVEHYPKDYDHTYGQALFYYPIIMWIPRIIWPDKPKGSEYPVSIATKKSINEFVIDVAGMAIPNIGEYYLDFGILGVIFFSFFIGLICKKMIKFYYSSSLYDIIVYAIFCGYLILFINRGYIAQLITFFVFLFWPLLLYRKFFKKNKKKYN